MVGFGSCWGMNSLSRGLLGLWAAKREYGSVLVILCVCVWSNRNSSPFHGCLLILLKLLKIDAVLRAGCIPRRWHSVPNFKDNGGEKDMLRVDEIT
jgi:hypothetical protein